MSILYQATYEVGNLSEWTGAQNPPGRPIQVVADPANASNKVGLFQLRNGDDAGGSAPGHRSEVYYSALKYVEGDERWFKFRVRLGAGFAVPGQEGNGNQQIVQWKNDGSGSAPFDLRIIETPEAGKAGRLALVDRRVFNFTTGMRRYWECPFSLEEQGTDTWLEFVVGVKFSSSASTGWLELRFQGARQQMKAVDPSKGTAALSQDGFRVYTDTLYAPGDSRDKSYFKQGYYSGSDLAFEGDVYHDGVVVATQEVDVVPAEPYRILYLADGAGEYVGTSGAALRAQVNAEAASVDSFMYGGDCYRDGNADNFATMIEQFAALLARRHIYTWQNHDFGQDSGRGNINPGLAALAPYFVPNGPHGCHKDVTPNGWMILSVHTQNWPGRMATDATKRSQILAWVASEVQAVQGRKLIVSVSEARYQAGTDYGDQPILTDLWDAIKGKAALWINGNEHSYNRLVAINGVVPITCGSGGRTPIDPVNTADNRLVAYDHTRHGAMRLDLTDQNIEFQFITADGVVRDSGTIVGDASAPPSGGGGGTPAPTPASTPPAISLGQVGAQSVEVLIAEPASSKTGDRIYLHLDRSNAAVAQLPLTARSHVITGLNPGQAYVIQAGIGSVANGFAPHGPELAVTTQSLGVPEPPAPQPTRYSAEVTSEVPRVPRDAIYSSEVTVELHKAPAPPPPVEPPEDPAAPPGTPVEEQESSIGLDLVAAMAPWITPDLEDYLLAVGSMFSEVEEFIEATEDGALLDPDECPAAALPYLAQFVGERLPVGIPEEEAREWIKDAPNQVRGTVGSIERAARRSLTGSRKVSVYEREGGNVDALGVVTYGEETPNPAQVLADLRTVVPIDLALNYRTLSGQPWSGISQDFTTWQDLLNSGMTWREVAERQAGSVEVVA